jgi:hypothetical protein
MSIEGTRRVMETTSHETANQYLRFGWSLINQYVVEATADEPRMVKFVLASVRRLEDTRQLVVVTEADEVNEYLAVGWKLIDKHVTSAESVQLRQETMRFVLAWQSEDPPLRPGPPSAATRQELTNVGELEADI